MHARAFVHINYFILLLLVFDFVKMGAVMTLPHYHLAERKIALEPS